MNALDPTAAVALAALAGLLIGSFLNVVIHRLPKMMEARWRDDCASMDGGTPPARERFDLVTPRSRCPRCGHAITALENVPVLSWLALRGRCRGCGTRIPARYPLVELLSAALAAASVWQFGPTAAGVAGAALGFFLVALAFIDLDTQFLPDDLTLPLLWLGLLINLRGTFAPLEDAVIGAVAGYLVLWLVYHAFRLLTGREGMGHGDFKLLAALGAWFGWMALPAVILASSLVGALVGIGLIVFRGHGREVPIPFGPYLAGAGLLVLHARPFASGLLGLP